MPEYFAVLTIVVLIGMVVTRAAILKRQGIATMQFGKLDKTDFLIPPIALFYFYLIFAHAFGWPTPARQELLSSDIPGWIGALFCLTGLALFLWSLVSFGQSFRVGIDVEHPTAPTFE